MTNVPRATRGSWTAPDDPKLALVLSLADDELMIGHRHSHWTGVAPTLEEDLAFSSLAQDEIGHAAIWYGVAEELTGEDEDTLAFGRRPEEYRHAVLLEREPGDWAYTIVRQHAYDLYDHVRMSVLTESTDASINGVLGPIMREERLHRAHARAWLDRVADGPGDGMERIRAGARRMLAEVGGLFETLPWEEELVKVGILPVSSQGMFEPWRQAMAEDYERFGLTDTLDAIDEAGGLGGRQGTHTEDFPPMWEEMTALYREHPGATW
ncbi:1,2-phenylacetyl-CoA epoxidase subunit PaaC [Euzebya pacifica]|jgi:ring-1,2-phenylacetyl-CoA epoxidase subunit PaaC|uniref:1,2-phenylacetyl-CoA epoxidase subunit PaaC n=1 Tax=Euzebya pacifica TaxID=1608957 RepID=UPI0030F73301